MEHKGDRKQISGLCCFPSSSWLVVHLLTPYSILLNSRFNLRLETLVISCHAKRILSENVYVNHSILSTSAFMAELCWADWWGSQWGISFRAEGSAFTLRTTPTAMISSESLFRGAWRPQGCWINRKVWHGSFYQLALSTSVIFQQISHSQWLSGLTCTCKIKKSPSLERNCGIFTKPVIKFCSVIKLNVQNTRDVQLRLHNLILNCHKVLKWSDKPHFHPPLLWLWCRFNKKN